MRRVAHIREGLGRVGALVPRPSDLGLAGPDPAVEIPYSLHDADEDSRSPIDLPQGPTPDEATDEDDIHPLFEVGPEMEVVVAAMGGETGRQIRESTQRLGVDALGYYLPFHFVGTQWGAYVKTSGIAWMAAQVFGSLKVPVERKCQMAFHAILAHELFHFAAEVAASQAELLFEQPSYVAAKIKAREKDPGYSVVEESLANAYMLARSRTSHPDLRAHGKLAALKDFVRKQPAGYRDCLGMTGYLWDAMRVDLLGEYSAVNPSLAQRSLLWSPQVGPDWPSLYPVSPKVPWRYCAIHLVDDFQRFNLPPGSIQHFARVEHIRESEEFSRMLHRLPPKLQQAWTNQKQRLAGAITAGADFKPWRQAGKDVYSVRVNRAVRAHLRYERGDRSWTALEIGTHATMGHG